MSLIAPTQPKRPSGKGGARKYENNRIYRNPLPLLFVPPPQAGYVSPHRVLGLFGLSGVRIENPHCEGILDLATRSVWVINEKDAMILWQRGFFGKGDLSRSEPSWYARQVNVRKAAGKCMYFIYHVFI
jgi:tRNA-splicing endonuclease subunit Sen2